MHFKFNTFVKNAIINHSFLGWFLIVTLLPLFGVIYLASSISERALSNEIIQNLSIIADKKANEIENSIDTSKKNAAVLSSDPTIINATENLISAYTNHQQAQYTNESNTLRLFLSRFLEDSTYSDIIILSLNGDVIYSTSQPDLIGKNYMSPALQSTELGKSFDNAKTLLETTLSNFEKNNQDGMRFYIANPVFKDNKIIGVIALQIDPSFIQKVVSDGKGLGISGETLVGVIKNGNIQPTAALRHATIKEFMNASATSKNMLSAFQDATLGQKSTGEMKNYQGDEVLAAWQYLPSMSWGMMIQLNKSEALKPVISLKDKILILGCIAILSSLILSYLIAARLQRTENQRKRLLIDLEAARNDALDATQAKTLFLANMSHELRTPLNAIIGYSEILHEDAIDLKLDGFSNDLDKISGAGKHLLGLINDILDISKIEAGKMDVYPEDINLPALLEDIHAMVKPLVLKKNNVFEMKYENTIEVMRTDMTKLRQCLLNLISNASKFTENGRITLKVVSYMNHDKEWMDFIVSDTGIGMSEEQLENLFQAFKQADASTTKKFGGTGLGLYLTKRFSVMLGGDINVTSEVNKGTSFVISLPKIFNSVFKEKPSEKSKDEPIASDVTLPVILIIDDDRKFHDFMIESLGDKFHFISTYDGESGLDVLKEKLPDAILLDVVMPKMDGWAVLGAIRSNPRLQNIPVVIATVMADKDLGYTLGAVDYLTKPINPEMFMQAIFKHMHKKQTDILIVDDDGVTRTLVSRMLKKAGMQTREAANGKQAIDLLEKKVPSLIILDLNMPVMNGFELIDVIRHNDKWQLIPIIILSSKDINEEEKKYLSIHTDQILRKNSHNRNEILEKINFQLDQSIKLEKKYQLGLIPHPSKNMLNIISTVQEELLNPTVENTQEKLILIIDDDRHLHDILHNLLEKEGYKIIHAYDGTQALELANEFMPDLIILDIVMKNLDGWMVLSQLQDGDKLRNIPIIMVSMSEEELTSLRGATDFVVKPINQDVLLNKLKKYIDKDKNNNNVLIVDDDDFTRGYYKRILKKLEWTITEAENGKVALERIQEKLPAVIILDLMMPVMNGFEVIAALHQNPAWSNIPVIVSSSKDLTTEEMSLLSKNVIKVFQKGKYRGQEMVSEVREILSENKQH